MSRAIGWSDVEHALALRPARRVDDPESSRAAVALVLREAGARLQLLFMQRAEHPEDPWSGQMSFPGGRAESGDPDLRATALRETREETGLAPGRLRELGRVDELQARSREGMLPLLISPFVFRLDGAAELRPNHEVQSLIWLGLDELIGPRHRSWLDYEAPAGSVRLPCLRVEQRVIWGLTYRMFTNVQELLERALEGAGVEARA